MMMIRNARHFFASQRERKLASMAFHYSNCTTNHQLSHGYRYPVRRSQQRLVLLEDTKIHHPSSTQLRSSAASTHDDSKPLPLPLQIQLYQYSICPFCHRVKALLDYAGMDYQVIEVNPLTKFEIKPWKKEYTKVPIATIAASSDENEKARSLFGSDVIVQGLLEYPSIQSALQGRWQDAGSNVMTLNAFQNAPAAVHWTNFAVTELSVLLYPNMCRTWGDSYRAFDYVHATTSTFGPLERVLIQTVGSFVRSKYCMRKTGSTTASHEIEFFLSTCFCSCNFAFSFLFVGWQCL